MIKETETATIRVVNFILIMIIVIEHYMCEMHYSICQYSNQNDSVQQKLIHDGWLSIYS